MKLLVGLLVMAIFVAQCSSSVSLRSRRQADEDSKKDTGVVAIATGFLGIVEGVPVFGGVIRAVRTRIIAFFIAVQTLTNGGFARVMGGALPCKVSLKQGFRCTGLTRGHHFTDLFIEVLRKIPVVPNIAITPISSALEKVVNPFLDIVFGGIYIQHT